MPRVPITIRSAPTSAATFTICSGVLPGLTRRISPRASIFASRNRPSAGLDQLVGGRLRPQVDVGALVLRVLAHVHHRDRRPEPAGHLERDREGLASLARPVDRDHDPVEHQVVTASVFAGRRGCADELELRADAVVKYAAAYGRADADRREVELPAHPALLVEPDRSPLRLRVLRRVDRAPDGEPDQREQQQQHAEQVRRHVQELEGRRREHEHQQRADHAVGRLRRHARAEPHRRDRTDQDRRGESRARSPRRGCARSPPRRPAGSPARGRCRRARTRGAPGTGASGR